MKCLLDCLLKCRSLNGDESSNFNLGNVFLFRTTSATNIEFSRRQVIHANITKMSVITTRCCMYLRFFQLSSCVNISTVVGIVCRLEDTVNVKGVE